MTSFVLLSGAAVLVACGLWFTGKVWGKHSRVQRICNALTLVGIAARFVMCGLNRDATTSTRALAVFPLGQRGVAVLREREIRTRFRNIDETSSAADFVTEWMLQTPGGAAIPLFQVDNFLGKRSWYFRGAHDRLWVSTGDSILLVSLVDGRVLHAHDAQARAARKLARGEHGRECEIHRGRQHATGRHPPVCLQRAGRPLRNTTSSIRIAPPAGRRRGGRAQPDAAFRIGIPRGRLAYQPPSRVVACPLSARPRPRRPSVGARAVGDHAVCSSDPDRIAYRG